MNPLIAKLIPVAMAALGDRDVRERLSETFDACLGSLERDGLPVRVVDGLIRDRGTGLATNTIRAALNDPQLRAWVRRNRRKGKR